MSIEQDIEDLERLIAAHERTRSHFIQIEGGSSAAWDARITREREQLLELKEKRATT